MSAPARPELEALGLSSTCVDVLRHLWDYLDEEMKPAGSARLRAHLATCVQCREYEGYQTCFLEAIARLKAGFGAPDSLRARLAEKLRGEGCGCWAEAKARK